MVHTCTPHIHHTHTHTRVHIGAGNNWAKGYTGVSNAHMCGVMESLRREMERCDMCSGVVMCSSAAGGTGSGLGARLCEEIGTHYTHTHLGNVLVCPYLTGEVQHVWCVWSICTHHTNVFPFVPLLVHTQVIVQYYNAALTLGHLLHSSSGVMLLENHTLDLTCTKVLKLTQPTFTDINTLIATHLTCAFTRETPHGVTSGMGRTALENVTQHLCAHPVSARAVRFVCVCAGACMCLCSSQGSVCIALPCTKPYV